MKKKQWNKTIKPQWKHNETWKNDENHEKQMMKNVKKNEKMKKMIKKW